MRKEIFEVLETRKNMRRVSMMVHQEAFPHLPSRTNFGGFEIVGGGG